MARNRKKPIQDQTRKLFEEGGMLQEGGTVDPESGNEVPTGSLQEEVRDDIPAQLSEGEFVFPADVVRFIGLERLMQMRQAAKRGLAQMDAMGQMGNSEEATMDDGDDTEFETEIDDILSEVEEEASSGKKSEGEPVKLAPGGLLGPANLDGAPQAGQYQFKAPEIPSYEMKTYSKPGQPDVYIPFSNGKPQLPVPEGYSETKKQVGFGGVLQEAADYTPTVTKTRGIRTGLEDTKPTEEVEKYGVETATEQEQKIESTGPVDALNYDIIDRLANQLKNQYNNIKGASGYKYKYESELDAIFKAQAAKLAANGINDISDVGYKEVEQSDFIKNAFKEGDKYFQHVEDQNTGTTEIQEIDPNKIKNINEIEVNSYDQDGNPIKVKRFEIETFAEPKRFLINKATGDVIKKVGLKGAWKGEDPTAFSFGKDVEIQQRNGFSRWGFDTSVKGMADYGVEFVDGNAYFIPVWKDTKTDLTPLVMMASIALMAAGVPAQIGQALAPTATAATGAAATAAAATTATATQLAIGNAVVGGAMSAITGQDVVKGAALGGISGYAAGTITPAFNTKIGEAILGSGVTGAQTLGSVISNSAVNGVMAAISGQDVGKAMLAGGVVGGVAANAADITKSLIGDNGIKAIANTTNLRPDQIQNMLSSTIVTGARALATGQDFFTSMRNHLLIQGLSTSATNAVVKGLRDNISPEAVKHIANVTKISTSIFTQAKLQGLDPVKVLQQAYPAIVLRSAMQ